jgi:hypothetical protein
MCLPNTVQTRKKPFHFWKGFSFLGVADGARTHDNRNHNPDSLIFASVEPCRYNQYKSTSYAISLDKLTASNVD